MNVPVEKPLFGAHVAKEARAITCARRMLAATFERGPVGPLDIQAEMMPTLELQQAAQIARGAYQAGCCGYAEVIGHAVQHTESATEQDRYRILIAGISEEPVERPESMEEAAATVRSYHAERTRYELAHELARTMEAGKDPAAVIKRIQESEDGAVTAPTTFAFHHADDTAGARAAMDFVEGLLTEGGASVIYGPSNCGKSFWIVDLAVAVATGTPFRDELEVDQGAVVYVALEGAHGATNRIAALKLAGILKSGAPFYLIFEPVSLLEAGHSAKLARTVSEVAAAAGMPVKLVILDTMARAMAGGDENSGQDMTAAVSSIDAIRAATGAHVAVVHHCGKDEAKGARGHSSLRAAVDTEIEISRPEGESISTVRVTKQRDLERLPPMPFSLKVVELGTDRRGKPITSCVVHHEDEMMASTSGKAGRKPTCTASEMLEFLPAANVKEWMGRVKEETGLGQTQFYAHKATLESGGKIRREIATNRILKA